MGGWWRNVSEPLWLLRPAEPTLGVGVASRLVGVVNDIRWWYRCRCLYIERKRVSLFDKISTSERGGVESVLYSEPEVSRYWNRTTMSFIVSHVSSTWRGLFWIYTLPPDLYAAETHVPLYVPECSLPLSLQPKLQLVCHSCQSVSHCHELRGKQSTQLHTVRSLSRLPCQTPPEDDIIVN